MKVVLIDELHSLNRQGDQMEGESGLTGSTIDELHSSNIQGGHMEGESIVLLELSLTNFFLCIF